MELNDQVFITLPPAQKALLYVSAQAGMYRPDKQLTYEDLERLCYVTKKPPLDLYVLLVPITKAGDRILPIGQKPSNAFGDNPQEDKHLRDYFLDLWDMSGDLCVLHQRGFMVVKDDHYDGRRLSLSAEIHCTLRGFSLLPPEHALEMDYPDNDLAERVWEESNKLRAELASN